MAEELGGGGQGAPPTPEAGATGAPPEMFTIRRNGAEVQVPRDELVGLAQKGYDADAKWQEAAQLRREAQARSEWIDYAEQDPDFAQYLQSYPGFQQGQGQQPQTGQTDPAYQELSERMAMMELQRQMDVLKARHGEAVDEEALVQFASERGIFDLGAAYDAMRGQNIDQLMADAEKRGREALAKELQENRASAVTSGGVAQQGFSPQPAEGAKGWAAAKAALHSAIVADQGSGQ